jgi:glycosyltransferase involved in cell wall biosynthesis
MKFFNMFKNPNIILLKNIVTLKNPAKLTRFISRAVGRFISLSMILFIKIIENSLGLLIALADIRPRKEIGKKILICRYKNYSLLSEFESMEKHHIDGTMIDNGYDVDVFYWDENESIFFSQVKLWLTIRRLNPWIIFFSSYTPRKKRPSSQPSLKFLTILRKKISSNFIFVWWDSCSDTFYDNEIKTLEKVKSLHLLMENPLLEFGNKYKNLNNDSLIPLWITCSLAKPLKKDIDVAFIGQVDSYRDKRKDFIEYLMEQNISGYIATLSRDHQISHIKYAEILGRAKIGINFSYSVDKHQLKGRVYDTLHSGALLLETKNSQTSAFFNDGEDFISFTDKEDMINKIRYYLSHHKEREKISSSGREKVLKLYNSELFMKKILDHKNFVNY